MAGLGEPWGSQAWSVAGTAPDGSDYSGRLEVQPSDDLWLMRWKLNGLPDQIGAGAMHNGELIVTRNPGVPRQGLVWYTPSVRGRLVATWNHCEPIGDRLAGGLASGNAIPGGFEITYFTPTGNAFPPLQLTIKRPEKSEESEESEESEVYELVWEGGKETQFGVGLDTLDGICAAWGSSRPITLLKYASPTDGCSTAISADTEHATTGQEVIKRSPF